MKLLTMDQVATVLCVSRFRAYELGRTGVIPVVRIGRQVRVSEAALERFIESGGQGLGDDDAA